MNPYLNRAMIQSPDQFFGRETEIARIFSRLGAHKPQSVSVVGDRRIGKSSLLYRLTDPAIQHQQLGQPLEIVAFIDFQQMRMADPQAFFTHFLEVCHRQCSDFPRSGKAGYPAFQEALEYCRTTGRRMVILLDEFDAVTSNPAFGLEFYSFLRSAANNYPVAYVTSSRTELQQLCHSSEVADSPFFNIFSNLRLRYLERADALRLIREPSQAVGTPLEPFEEEILRIAGSFPFYLQIACSAYFDHLRRNPGKPPEQEEIEEQFLEEAGPHIQYFWEHAEPEVAAVLKAILRSRQPAPEQQFVCQRLQREGYVLKEQNSYRIFSPVFEAHLRLLDTTSELRRGRPGSAVVDGESVELRPGSRLNQYEIAAKAAEGGMGVVYQALDTDLKRRVALKILQPDLRELESSRRRFLNEARAAAVLSHPVITTVYELFELQNQVVLVMEWLEGKTLKELVRASGPQPWREITLWLVSVCDGLEAAHARRIVHRDIKSSNIMITVKNEVKITDFGLAKFRDTAMAGTQITKEGTILGTLAYMSPEQVAAGDAVDERSDLFSLGVVFFECLTGALPFQRSSVTSTLHAIASEPAPYLGLYHVQNSERIDRVIRKLLEKKPTDRYQTAAELRADLKSLLRKETSIFFWRR